jgi:hypothetical protein
VTDRFLHREEEEVEKLFLWDPSLTARAVPLMMHMAWAAGPSG